MDEILKLLAQYPIALIIFGSLLGLLLLTITIIYIIAFLQGREISFYPPKIGNKPASNKEKKETEIPVVTSNLIPETENNLHQLPTLERSDISISTSALTDCKQLNISTEVIANFIVGEAIRHPALFTTSFSSLPLAFENTVIFLSWDSTQAIIERILLRSDAYPTSETWFVCVSLYRQATTLPYRNKKTKAVLSEAESRRIVNLYKKLLRNIKEFIEHNKGMDGTISGNISIFESLLDEAEFSLFNENHDMGIVRLEALLSSIHKFLLLNAPQVNKKNTQKSEHTESITPKLNGEGEKSVLLVDDTLITLEGLKVILSNEGYRIATAHNGEEALKAMVENDYDLVITDMVMPILDGREVAIGAKTISPKTKILLLTAYAEISNKVSEMPTDGFLLKGFTKSELLSCIRSLLMQNPA